MMHFKNILSLSLALSIGSAMAQSAHEKKFFKETVEDTVKNESVVIVRDFDEYIITAKGNGDYKVNVVARTQYKLKDPYAVQAFSTITKSSGLRKIIITQLKPNGLLKEIYLKEDKDYDENKTYGNVKFEDGEDKIAVEDLEIGDIVDYRYEWSYSTAVLPTRQLQLENGRMTGYTVNVKNYNIFKRLPESTRFLQERYPTFSSMVVFEVPKELKLLQKSVNCSYKFDETDEGNAKVYKCKIGYIKAYKSEYFSYAYINLPVVKYCLVQTASDPAAALYAFQFNDENITAEDVAGLGRSFYRNKKFIPHYLYYTNTRKYSGGYEDVSLNAFFTAFLKTFRSSKTKLEMLNQFHEYLSNNDEINQWQFGKMNFAVIMARFCDKIKQPYKMLACLQKYEGEWNDVIYPGDINWGIFIENGDNDLYITSTAKESNIYTRSGSLSGTKAIVFSPKDKEAPETITYPEVGYDKNLIKYESEVELSDENKFTYHFTNQYTYTGEMIDNIDENISYKFYPDELSTNAPFWGIVNYSLYNEELFRDSSDYMPEFRRIGSSFSDRRDEKTKEGFAEFLYSEYHFDDIEVDSFRIIEGMGYVDGPEAQCVFKVEFNSSKVIEKGAGNYLLMNLGRLITEQMEVSNFKKNLRSTDVYITDMKEIQWSIDVELPKGYTPLNLDEFNTNFKNEAGIFNAKLTLEGNHIRINVTKIYNTHYLPKEKWPEMIDFLKTAVLFFEKKLLLEKQ